MATNKRIEENLDEYTDEELVSSFLRPAIIEAAGSGYSHHAIKSALMRRAYTMEILDCDDRAAAIDRLEIFMRGFILDLRIKENEINK